ncbi:histidine kinase dimerization/phospho-acceptor domain-containing protein [Bradyrhizobium sp. JR3.5]
MNRVSMMGELAASLSHEILHPIATARNNARTGMRFLEMNPPNLDEAREALGCVVRDADRAKDIVGRIRTQINKAPPHLLQRWSLGITCSSVDRCRTVRLEISNRVVPKPSLSTSNHQRTSHDHRAIDVGAVSRQNATQ